MAVLETPVSRRQLIGLDMPGFGRAAHLGAKELYVGVYRESDEKWGIMYNTYVASRRAFDAAATLIHPASELIGLLRVPPEWQEDMQAYFERFTSPYRTDDMVALGKVGLFIDEQRPAFRRRRLVAVTENYKPKNLLDDKRSMPGLGYATEIIVLTHLQGDITHVSTTAGPSIDRIAQLGSVGLEPGTVTRVETWIAAISAGLARSLMRA